MGDPLGIRAARFGWPHQFKERSWADVAAFENHVWANTPAGRYVVEIVESVLASGVADVLAVTTSMHDLVVVGRPVPDPPMDVLVVRASSSLKAPAANHVRIEYLANSGRNTSIERPSQEAVRLFWRFVKEKFGIVATHRGPASARSNP